MVLNLKEPLLPREGDAAPDGCRMDPSARSLYVIMTGCYND
jgi:hypothetical protein